MEDFRLLTYILNVTPAHSVPRVGDHLKKNVQVFGSKEIVLILNEQLPTLLMILKHQTYTFLGSSHEF